MKNIILAIETSCDDTAAAVFCDSVELSSVVSSQIDIHNRFGGVVPEIASRNHTMALPSVVGQALQVANKTLGDIDYVACTVGPGLNGALLAGVSYAKALAYGLKIDLLPVNHMQAHIAANFLNVEPPFLCLVVSGGHTSVVDVLGWGHFVELASTADDAAGEAFDKVARVLGLPYPGGPQIEELAKKGTPCINFFRNRKINEIPLSFSGLKTATINWIRQRQEEGDLQRYLPDICASFGQAVIDIAVNHTIKLALQTGRKSICLAGGVAANKQLRAELTQQAQKRGMQVYCPELRFCTDNAAMVALCAYYQYLACGADGQIGEWLGLNVDSRRGVV